MKHLKFLRLPLIIGAAFTFAACGGSEPTSEAHVKEAVKNIEAPAEERAAEIKKPATEKAPAKSATELTQEAMLKRGRIVWFKCRSCHELGVDGPHKVGPNLNGLIGAKAGMKEGYVFSKAFTSADIIWTDETLDAFIEKPTAYIKGTKMAFVGIKKESDRQAVIEYIKENAKIVE